MEHGQVSKEIAKGLIALQERIKTANIPPSKLDETLNIATWNIREFGKAKRSEAAIHYIAEILGQFDIVSIVELQQDLTDLGHVLKILGPYWRAIYSDVTSDKAGDYERIALVYDKRAVVFNGLAAEATAPRVKQGQDYFAPITWWRSPYIASFRAGNYDFVAVIAHIRWGKGLAGRKKELQLLADWVDARRKTAHAEDLDFIVMGDFNIPSTDDALFQAVTSRGLQIPKALRGLSHGTNLERDKRYDQILQYANYDNSFTDEGGVLDFFIDESRIAELFPGGVSKTAFTFEMSDHLPLWMQVNTDISGQQLQQIIQG
jgi:hypothetical protein